MTIASLPSWPASAHAVAYQINPAHSGYVAFSSVTFPTASTWTVDLGATVSYALIASGKVFVMTYSSTGSDLYALDQTTGGTVWGPVAIPGTASPAYDNGVVFVSSGIGAEGASPAPIGSVRAYDAATGALLWNRPMSGFDGGSTSAPTALNGYVYVTGGVSDPHNDGTFALNESTGAVSWFAPGGGVGASSPAVSASGVYVDFVCASYAFNPSTGQQLWASQGLCSSSGISGTTLFLAGNALFAPSMMTSGYGGNVLDAGTGATTGTFAAQIPPVFDAQTGYFVQMGQSGGPGTLQAITLSSNTVKWTFTGDSVCAALVISQYVIAEGCGGKLYALDAATGQQVWLTTPGAPSSWNLTGQPPLVAVAAGDGMLLIPAQTQLIAYTLATSR